MKNITYKEPRQVGKHTEMMMVVTATMIVMMAVVVVCICVYERI